MFTTDFEYECSCVSGPAGTCSNCKRHDAQEEPQSSAPYVRMDYDFSSMYHQILPDLSDYSPIKYKTVKVKWVESVTDKAVLVLSKKNQWYWIPISLIEHAEQTSKGNFKLKIPEDFKKKVIQVSNHHYFDRDEYVKPKS